jgi:hypothetical protein
MFQTHLSFLIPFRLGIHIYLSLLFQIIYLSSVLFSSQHSFYTCRYFHLLIYIPPGYSRLILTFDPACFIGVDG